LHVVLLDLRLVRDLRAQFLGPAASLLSLQIQNGRSVGRPPARIGGNIFQNEVASGKSVQETIRRRHRFVTAFEPARTLRSRGIGRHRRRGAQLR
jgi:hypothetical protein